MSFDLQQTKVSPAALSLWLKERAYSSPALKYPYRSLGDIQSQLALLRNQPYEAAASMLRTWRHLGTEGFGPKRVARVMQVVRENCFRPKPTDGARERSIGGASDGTRDGIVAELLPATENRLRLEFVRSAKAQALRQVYGSFPMDHRLRLRFPNDDDPERQGDLIILKPYDETTGERGVIMLMYSEAVMAAAAVYDLGALAARYMFVLEPSWWGYQDARFLLYLGSDLDILVQSPRRADFEFVADLRTNLVPVRVGAGEWGDPSVFRPRAANQEAKYDAVMVAAWDPLKRHEVFFRAAQRFRHEHGRALRFALVGYELGWNRAAIERLLGQYDLERDCDIFENIPHAEVARIVADAKLSLLLSMREGANRAIYESMFCGTPVIVYRHQCGVNLDHVNASTGLLADEAELPGAIKYLLDHHGDFQPRAWALENAGYLNANQKINAALSEMARRRELPWTRDIAAKKSAPNLRYAEAGLYREFASEYESLEPYLL
jgi:glycosyltransferase involved in cell wall biosynthesis